MFSVRALARTAPRAASSLVSRRVPVAFQPIRSAVASSVSRSAVVAFSTSRARADQYSQQLAAKLASEISIEADETNSSATSDSNVQKFLSENPDWTVQDKEGQQDVYFTRKFEDETITVQFNIADFETGALDPEEADAALHDEDDLPGSKQHVEEFSEEDELQPAFSVNVNVLVQRPNKGSLKFQLIAENGEFLIDRVLVLPQSSVSAAELLKEESTSTYTGPPFGQLDDELQSIIDAYLYARGITPHFASVVPDYIDGKEQKEYLAWLDRVKTFVN